MTHELMARCFAMHLRVRIWFTSRLRTSLGVGLLTRIAIVSVALLLLRDTAVEPDRFLLHGGQPHPVAVVDLFQRWDAYWFLNIAREGYQYHGVQPQIGRVPFQEHETNVTPFPLYPTLVRLLGHLTGDLSLAGLIIALTCYLLALFVLHPLAGDPDEARRTLLYLSIYPTAFIYNAPYSESLYLLLTVLCLSECEAGRWLTAGLSGLAAAGTRLAGALLSPCVLVGLWRRDWKRPLRPLLAAALVLVGVGGYFLFLHHVTGDIWAYFTAQQGWRKGLVWPWTALGQLFATARQPMTMIYLCAVGLFVPLAAASVHAALRKHTLPPEQALYLGLGTLMPLCSSSPLGLPRYYMVLFPAFVLLARLGRQLAAHLTIVALFGLVHVWVMFQWLTWQHSL